MTKLNKNFQILNLYSKNQFLKYLFFNLFKERWIMVHIYFICSNMNYLKNLFIWIYIKQVFKVL